MLGAVRGLFDSYLSLVLGKAMYSFPRHIAQAKKRHIYQSPQAWSRQWQPFMRWVLWPCESHGWPLAYTVNLVAWPLTKEDITLWKPKFRLPYICYSHISGKWQLTAITPQQPSIHINLYWHYSRQLEVTHSLFQIQFRVPKPSSLPAVPFSLLFCFIKIVI